MVLVSGSGTFFEEFWCWLQGSIILEGKDSSLLPHVPILTIPHRVNPNP